MRTQADTLQMVRSKVNYSKMLPSEAAQALADAVGMQEARDAVRKIITEVENDVAEWDYWTDVRLWLLH